MTGLLAASAVVSAAFTGITASAAESTERIEVVPAIEYKATIFTLDDYILAVKRTAHTNEEIKQALAAAENYVPSVDNSKLKYFPEIGNQGSIGSCVAWSGVYYQFTHEVNKALDRAASKETTFQPMFIYNLYIGCNQPSFLENLLNSTGCAPVSMVEDTQNDKTWSAEYDIWREATNYRISSHMGVAGVGEKGREITSVDDPDLDAIKAILRNGDVLSYSGFINTYVWDKVAAAPGVDQDIVGELLVTKTVGRANSSHMLTVVGYNDNIWCDLNKNGKVDAGEKGALKVANSWGSSKPFFWVAYDALNEKSSVEGVVSESNRLTSMSGFMKLNVSKDFGTSRIFFKYTLNSDNRTDSYIEINAKRRSDGVTLVRKVNPYAYNSYEKATCQRLNYKGEKGFCDGSMLVDLNNIIKDIDSNTLNDYEWSFRFVDKGADTSATTVKEAYIIDENTGKRYDLDIQYPFQINKSEKTAAVKNYYNFTKLYVPAANTLTVGSDLKFTFKTANETYGDTPIKYTMTVSKDGKQIFSKQHKASSIDRQKGSSVIKGSWKPTATGTYKITITGTDASGVTASRSAEFRVYNKQLAIRSIELDKGKYIDPLTTVKITPVVTGGTAPYTYSYYYVKGGKTYKISENTKSSSKTKKFGANTGKYSVIVKVTDSKGNVAKAAQCIVVNQPQVTKFVYNKKEGKVGESIYVRADANYVPDVIKDTEYVYTVERGGIKETLPYSDPNWPNQVVWKPKEAGTYNITCSIKYGDKILGSKTVAYEVAPAQAATRRINVNVITYICNETSASNYYVHYWGGKGGSGDVKCTALSTTKKKDVGYWGSAQTFQQFIADIPADATGYKFHIGSRWFPAGSDSAGDGKTSTTNTAYIFNYDNDKVIYTKE